MNLEETIKHCDEVAKENYLQGMLCHANPNDEHLDNCIECAKQHEQLKTWLIDYKKLVEENELLKRENAALADDNEMKCERYAEAKKALKRACMKLSEVSQIPIDSEYHAILPIMSAEEWEKEMMKDE